MRIFCSLWGGGRGSTHLIVNKISVVVFPDAGQREGGLQIGDRLIQLTPHSGQLYPVSGNIILWTITRFEENYVRFFQ